MDELKQIIRAYLDAANYQFRNGFWFKGRGTVTQSDDKIIAGLNAEVRDNNTKVAILAAIRSIEEDFESSETDSSEVDNSVIFVRDFLIAYENLLLRKWSTVDEEVYRGLKYTMDNETPIILAPTGNCMEYTIVGRTSSELYAALAGISIEGGTISRLKYIENSIVDPILRVCFSNAPQRPEVLDPTVLSSAALDSMYGKKPVFDDGELVGYNLQYIQGKPTVLRYVQVSLESFLANPDNYIAYMPPISNVPEQPTYRYIPKNLKKGNISAYEKWFNDTFENPKESFDVFATFFGAVLDPNNMGKQTLYIQGFGNDAKTTVITILGNYLKNAFRPIDHKLMDDGHGWEQFVGTRLGLLDDTKNYSLHRTNWVHKITTPRSKILINPKHKATYTIEAITKLIQLENSPPEINLQEENQTSRVIYLRCKRKTDNEKIKAGISVRQADGTVSNVFNPAFVDELTAQAEAFLAVCMEKYADPNGLCPTKAQIIVPKIINDWMVEDCSDVKDDMVEIALSQLIVEDPEGFVSRTDLFDRVKEIMKKEWHGLSTPRTISLMMTKLYNATFKHKRVGPVRIRGWEGVKLSTYIEPRKELTPSEQAASFKKPEIRDDLVMVPVTDKEMWEME